MHRTANTLSCSTAMARGIDDPRAKLKHLRDRLASELPRARIRANVPPSLVDRLDAALELVANVYRLGASSPSKALDEVHEDAVVEAHLALHDWERWLEQDQKQKRLTTKPPAAERRQHERHDTNVTVKLLRYRVRPDELGEVQLDSETTSRPARNLSPGGIFVLVPVGELAQVGVGGVVHVSVRFGSAASFQARATVQRRDATGVGLCWIQDSDRGRAAIESLLDAVRRSRSGK